MEHVSTKGDLFCHLISCVHVINLLSNLDLFLSKYKEVLKLANKIASSDPDQTLWSTIVDGYRGLTKERIAYAILNKAQVAFFRNIYKAVSPLKAENYFSSRRFRVTMNPSIEFCNQELPLKLGFEFSDVRRACSEVHLPQLFF